MSKKSKSLNEDKLNKVSGGNAEFSQYYNSNNGKNVVVASWDNDDESRNWVANKAIDYAQGKMVSNNALDNKPAWNNLSEDEDKF